MGLFRGIKDSIRDEELLRGLCEHFQKIDINATVLESEPKVQAFTSFVGSVNVESRDIDAVEVEMKRVGGGDFIADAEFGDAIDHGTKVYRYNYVLRIRIDGLKNKLKAELKPIKKGFFSREVVGQKWEGEYLAQLLNADSELMNMLVRDGLVKLEIRPDKKSQCVKMRQKTFYPKTALAFPTSETFKIYSRIAQHIRSIPTAQI